MLIRGSRNCMVRFMANGLGKVRHLALDMDGTIYSGGTLVPEYSHSPAYGEYNGAEGEGEPNSNSFSLKRRIGSAIAKEERKLIGDVLNKTNWNRRKAADLLEISYRSLLYKIKEYNLNTSK